MMFKRSFKSIMTVFFIVAISDVYALSSEPILTPAVHSQTVDPSNDIMKQLSCFEIDQAITALHPQLYDDKSKTYQENINKVPVALTMIDGMPFLTGLVGISYMGYTFLIEDKEERRVMDVREKMAVFQRLKAEKHCFE